MSETDVDLNAYLKMRKEQYTDMLKSLVID